MEKLILADGKVELEVKSGKTRKLTDFTEFESKINLKAAFRREESAENVEENLGIYRCGSDDIYRTGCFAGYTWLKDRNGEIVRDAEGNKVVLSVAPRFDLSISTMLNKIAEDDEFEDYLCMNQEKGERMFTFFFDEPLITADISVNPNRIISIWSFIILLKNTLERPLMMKMVKKENNFVGKAKGKILFNKQISRNILQGHEERIYCSYNEKSADIKENQILKYTLLKAEEYILREMRENKKRTNQQNRKILQYISLCKLKLAHISDFTFSAQDIDKINLPAMYQHYRPLLQLAKVVIMEQSADININNNQNVQVIPYAVNMPLLFECYCRTLMKQYIAETEYLKSLKMLKYVPDKSRKNYGSEYGCHMLDESKKAYISGMVIPDIVLEDDEGKVSVFDVKYKDVDIPNREDRLQILAYAEIFYHNLTGFGHIFPNKKNRTKDKDWSKDVFLTGTEAKLNRSIKFPYIHIFVRT